MTAEADILKPVPEELLQAAIHYTAAQTGFSLQLVEKDYQCSRVLAGLACQENGPLVFKGGTCLSKVFAAFYRLSEDLDFVIPISHAAVRGDRRSAVAPVKAHVGQLPELVPGLELKTPLTGYNNSTQYIAQFQYRSAVTAAHGEVKFEVGLREALLLPAVACPCHTLLANPLRRSPMFAPFPLRCMAMQEAYAEKARAALSRREPAIRDFFDLDHAVRQLALNCTDTGFVHLLAEKLDVPGNFPVDVSDARLASLRRQLDANLKPVLRQAEYEAFDLDRAFALARQLAGAVATV